MRFVFLGTAPRTIGGAVAGVGGGAIIRGSLSVVISTASAADRAGALATYFTAGYVGVSLPVLGAGVASTRRSTPNGRPRGRCAGDATQRPVRGRCDYGRKVIVPPFGLLRNRSFGSTCSSASARRTAPVPWPLTATMSSPASSRNCSIWARG